MIEIRCGCVRDEVKTQESDGAIPVPERHCLYQRALYSRAGARRFQAKILVNSVALQLRTTRECCS